MTFTSCKLGDRVRHLVHQCTGIVVQDTGLGIYIVRFFLHPEKTAMLYPKAYHDDELALVSRKQVKR